MPRFNEYVEDSPTADLSDGTAKFVMLNPDGTTAEATLDAVDAAIGAAGSGTVYSVDGLTGTVSLTSRYAPGSSTPPTSPFAYQSWVDSSTGRQYCYIDGFWVEVGASAGSFGGGIIGLDQGGFGVDMRSDVGNPETGLAAVGAQPLTTPVIRVDGLTATLNSTFQGMPVMCTNTALVSVRVPSDAEDDLPVGYQTLIIAAGAAGVVFDFSDVTVLASLVTSIAFGESISLLKSAADQWVVLTHGQSESGVTAPSPSDGITLVGTGGDWSSTSEELAVSLPAGYALNDFAVLFYYSDDAAAGTFSDVSTPSGWTLATGWPITSTSGRQRKTWLFTKRLAASETAPSLAVTNAVYRNRSAVLGVFRGVNTVTALDVDPVSGVGSNTATPTLSNITTVSSSCRIVQVLGVTHNTTFAAPTGFTLGSVQTPDTWHGNTAIAYDLSSRATGLQTMAAWAGGNALAEYSGATIALRPADATAPGPVDPPDPVDPNPPVDAVAWFDFAGATPSSSLVLGSGANNDLAPYMFNMTPTSAQDWTWPLTTLSNGYIRIKARDGKKGPGLQMLVNLDSNVQSMHMFMEWEIMFEAGYSWGTTNFGGKFGGFAIGAGADGGVSDLQELEDGGSVRLTWQNPSGANGTFGAYVYDRSVGLDYGNHFPCVGRVIVPGQKYKFGLEVDVSLGVVKIWQDDVLCLNQSGFDWPSLNIKSLYTPSVFHGGGDDTYGPDGVCYSRVYNAQIYQM